MHRRPSVALALVLSLLALPAAAQEASTEVPAPPEPAPFDLDARISEGPPMTADRAAQRASETAPTMEQARALRDAAEASVARARAMMLPRLDLSARYTHIDGFPDGSIGVGADPAALAAARMLAQSVSDPAARALWLNNIDSQASAGSVTISIPRDQIAFSARLTWPVSDLFFAVFPAVDAAQAGARARGHQLAAADWQVQLQAREAFYQLARARGALAVAEEARHQAVAQQAQIDSAVRAGFLTDADGLAAAARVASADQAIASARAGVILTDAALRTLIGEEDGEPYGIAEPIEADGEPAEGGVPELTQRALAQRHELEALRESLAAQQSAARAQDATGYPHVALYAGADLANPNRYQIPPTAEFTPSWEVGAMLTWSPNDALNAYHRGQELGFEQAATEAQIEQLERGVRLEVRRAHAELTAAHEGLLAARAALRAAEAAYASRLAQLRAGEGTTADVFAAEGMVNGARLSELDATVQVRLASTHLGYAVGEP